MFQNISVVSCFINTLNEVDFLKMKSGRMLMVYLLKKLIAVIYDVTIVSSLGRRLDKVAWDDIPFPISIRCPKL